MALKWNGKKVTEALRRAQLHGVNQTLAAAVARAKRSHAWRNRTGTLEGSIDIQDYAHATGDGVRGSWGSRDVRYALIHELGGVIRPQTAKALVFEPAPGAGLVQVQSVTIPPRPYLRPAADAEYPKLGARIRAALEKAGG